LTARLVALDWGTSSLRAWLLGDGGAMLAEKSAPLGILKVPNGDFAAAFRATCGEWPTHALPAIASGMIGSRQGWVEAPYAACPAGFEAFTRGLAWVEAGGARLAIVPGVSCVDASGVPTSCAARRRRCSARSTLPTAFSSCLARTASG
jgi:2-dehydro-3-deoxygalactonokinase